MTFAPGGTTREVSPRQPRRHNRRAAPLLVLVISLVITAAATTYVARTLAIRDKIRFNTAVNQARDRITTRLDTYINMLRGAEGLFASRFPVKPQEFIAYTDRLEVRQRYPGIQGIGFSVRFTEEQRVGLETIMQGMGEPTFRTWPRDTGTDEHHAIVYISPRDERNVAVIGFDMYSEPVRRLAMQRARDTGQPAASGKVTLIQELDHSDMQWGFLIYSPVYTGGAIPTTVEARREKLLGFVYAPFRTRDLLQGIFQNDPEPWLDFHIYDGREMTHEHLLYATIEDDPKSPRYARDSAIEVAGREWMLRFRTRREFQSAWARLAVPATALGGGALSFALFLFASAQVNARMRAERLLEELLAAKEAADAARLEAETASRLKDEFLATVSHELRTPLNAILGWTQLLLDPRADPSEAKHGLDVIDRNARAQARLVEDLLDVSRIVAGKLRLDFHPVDLAQVVEAAVQTVRPTADVKGVELSTHLEHACCVAGDAARLQQVIWNLLSNAVKFTPRGGKVEVDTSVSDNEVRITVRDTGKGIAPDFLPYVFERFRQADATTTRKFGGLGLGLGIARHLVHLHGGTISAHSDGEDRGATFTVTLPLARHTAGAVAPGPAADEYAPINGISVLVVEDEPDTAELLARFLKEANATVSMATSALEGINHFKDAHIDVIVSDISMPEEDGYSMLRKIRAIEQSEPNGRPVPAIALTAYARPEDRARALDAGYQLHLPKPVQKQQVLAAIVAVLKTDVQPL